MVAEMPNAVRYARTPDPKGEDRDYLDFVLGLKLYWSRRLYPALAAKYEAALAGRPDRPASGEEAAPIVESIPEYRFFGWLERNTQNMMWRRLQSMVDTNGADALETLETPIPNPIGRLELNPDLPLPAYYTEPDFHVQPGGVWSGNRNAFVYEIGAKIVMFGKNDDYLFHRLFVQTAIPKRDYRTILDFGCGFGKSTRPLVDAFPNASVTGIDLSAPNLKLAHHQAERLGKRITFSQRNIEQTGYPDASFDLVTSTMVIHELPMPVLRRVLMECYRLLRPGGVLAILDFHRTGDPFRDFAMIGHGARNNEPYMPHLFRTDIVRLLGEIGFRQPELLPFDERGAGLLPDGRWPERSEWHFPWVVIRGER